MENLKQEKTICDKCGEPIDNDMWVRYVTIESPAIKQFPDCDVYELCPKCANKLSEWLNTKEEETK